MAVFLAKRFLQLVPVLWGVGTIVFFLLHLVPGDPVEIMLGENAMLASKDAMRKSLHLDRPLIDQYKEFWLALAKGDLGKSFLNKKPVASLISERIVATFSLAFVALACALIVAIPIGVVAAMYRDSWFDRFVLLFSILGASMPNFWLGPLVMLFFAVKLNWFPVSEQEGAISYVLPAFTLGLGLSAVLIRITRASMAEVLGQDYIVTAKSKGLSLFTIYFKHALKNALIPIISILGLQMGALLAGAVVTETIFDWPGLGELVYRGIQSRDFPLVQGSVLVIAACYVMVNTIADIAYKFANPRIDIQ